MHVLHVECAQHVHVANYTMYMCIEAIRNTCSVVIVDFFGRNLFSDLIEIYVLHELTSKTVTQKKIFNNETLFFNFIIVVIGLVCLLFNVLIYCTSTGILSLEERSVSLYPGQLILFINKVHSYVHMFYVPTETTYLFFSPAV